MKAIIRFVALLCFSAACSRLPTLTPESLSQAEQRWATHRPAFYRLIVEMSGDRIEKGRFEVEVRSAQTVSLRRNGMVIRPNAGQDYSMDGLFHMLEQEIGLSEKPETVGAAPGYSVYTTAKFDDATGRLIHYRRIVGGASNSIDVTVVEYVERSD